MKRSLAIFLGVAMLLVWPMLPAAADPGVDVLLQVLKECQRPSLRASEQCAWMRPAAADPAPLVGPADQTGFVKGLYFIGNALSSSALRRRVQTLLETTELNAIVIDVKGDFGHLAYPSLVDATLQTGAVRKQLMNEETWTEFMQWFAERGVTTIARIVTFKDDPLATAHPEWAVSDSETGELWRDGERLAWTDPFIEEVQDYNVALAVEAAERGFDEIQFDYVRFPSDGLISRATLSQENTRENRIATVAAFLEKAQQALAPYDVKIGADVFGYAIWMREDLKIGHNIEALAAHLDVLSPMLYPSTFATGLPGHEPSYRPAIDHPYEIVFESTQRAVERATAVNPEIEIRPWLQDFKDYAFDGRRYGADDIRLQMEGARAGGARGWILWDPAMNYTPAALVSATPSFAPNTDGRVLVLEYHHIGEPEDRWQRTPDNFRADLERLLAAGYYPVNLRDLVEGQLAMVPAGKRPLVLTFDDSLASQFRILPDGSIDPDTAVGILLAFHEQHPADWPRRATFFVLQGEGEPGALLFGQPDLALQKLALLVGWGMEVGSHTLSHANLHDLGAAAVQRELALSQAQLEEWLPGYDIVSLSLPYGAYPEDSSLLAAGQHGDLSYTYAAAVMVGASPAPSPRSPRFDAYHIPRVQAIQSELDYWLPYLDQPGVHYVSAGE